VYDALAKESTEKIGITTSGFQKSNNFINQLESLNFEIYSALMSNIYKQVDTFVMPVMLRYKEIDLDENPQLPKNHELWNNLWFLSDVIQSANQVKLYNSIIKQIFQQVFYYINAKIFNTFLTKREFCSYSIALQLKLRISQLEEWVTSFKEMTEFAITQLDHIREAVNMLLVVDKTEFTDSDVKVMFSKLTAQQVKKNIRLIYTRSTTS